jgi:hypothetical protein
MSKETYKTMPNKIAQLIPFEGNSARGFWDGHTFKIYSYSTLIASADGINSEYLNVNKYSVTTSRLQHIIKTAWKI